MGIFRFAPAELPSAENSMRIIDECIETLDSLIATETSRTSLDYSVNARIICAWVRGCFSRKVFVWEIADRQGRIGELMEWLQVDRIQIGSHPTNHMDVTGTAFDRLSESREKLDELLAVPGARSCVAQYLCAALCYGVLEWMLRKGRASFYPETEMNLLRLL